MRGNADDGTAKFKIDVKSPDLLLDVHVAVSGLHRPSFVEMIADRHQPLPGRDIAARLAIVEEGGAEPVLVEWHDEASGHQRQHPAAVAAKAVIFSADIARLELGPKIDLEGPQAKADIRDQVIAFI